MSNKTIVLIQLITIFATGLFAQKQSNLIKKLRVKNKICKKLTFEFTPKTGDSLLTFCNHYNKLGNQTKDLRYNKEGATRWQYIIEYNDKHLISKQMGYDEENTMLTKQTKYYFVKCPQTQD